MGKRFEIEKTKMEFGSEIYVLTDKETGIQYLYFRNGASGGLTPLLDSKGYPSVKK